MRWAGGSPAAEPDFPAQNDSSPLGADSHVTVAVQAGSLRVGSVLPRDWDEEPRWGAPAPQFSAERLPPSYEPADAAQSPVAALRPAGELGWHRPRWPWAWD